uniref:Dynein, light chain, Tctex-type 1 n=1 Tax=Mastacembelus armatus TaxID=205130 RepID=A0A3Q3LQJ0_9TELE
KRNKRFRLELCEVTAEVSNPCFLAIAIANTYQQSRVNQWTTSIVEQCLSQLSKLGKPFKYIGGPNSKVAFCAVRWENKSMYCIVNVFGLAI